MILISRVLRGVQLFPVVCLHRVSFAKDAVWENMLREKGIPENNFCPDPQKKQKKQKTCSSCEGRTGGGLDLDRRKQMEGDFSFAMIEKEKA